jgi:predicted lipoprotein with Yx(FWY)xxD motif
VRRVTSVSVIAVVIIALWALPADSSPAAKNLVVTPGVRATLLATGAASHDLPLKDYIGLAKGVTYYAFDEANKTYYAAAGLDPSPKSMAAQVASQDDGAYYLFTRAFGATKWKIYDDGLGGSDGAQCPITLPSAVRDVWAWTLKCSPPGF